MNPQVEVEEVVEEKVTFPWFVVLFNDEIHSFEEVIYQLMIATKCSAEQGEAWAWEVHTKGKARVYQGALEECLKVNGILREIQLVTEIQG
jgi:ATP-dependent Clp protease adaptor protein ClpS